MTGILSLVLGRMPIGWLQLTHNRGRLLAALAGVSFANVLVFVQLGILGGMNTSIEANYSFLDADIMISAADANTLTEGGNVPRQALIRALGVPGVSGGIPLFLGTGSWDHANGDTTSFQIFGLPADAARYVNPAFGLPMDRLAVPDTVILDTNARYLPEAALSDVSPSAPVALELNDRSLRAIGTFDGGSSLSSDGSAFMSDQSFLALFPQRSSRAPDHILLTVTPGARVESVVERLSLVLDPDLRVRTLQAAATEDRVYQTTVRPTGLIFGFGVVMGVIVGLIIVYQILATDVADHIREYATFQAMGYDYRFFLGVVFEQALVLAVLGFLPGILIGWALYLALNQMTGLPIEMDAARAATVFLGTVAACAVSGAIATRRLVGADPADLF